MGKTTKKDINIEWFVEVFEENQFNYCYEDILSYLCLLNDLFEVDESGNYCYLIKLCDGKMFLFKGNSKYDDLDLDELIEIVEDSIEKNALDGFVKFLC